MDYDSEDLAWIHQIHHGNSVGVGAELVKPLLQYVTYFEKTYCSF